MQLKNVKKLLSCLVFFAFIFSTDLISLEAFSATIYVPDNYLTIQSAVNATSPGDTIIVRDGTYTENVDVNKDHLTIQSENGAEKTIVQAADPNDHIFTVTADYVNISGFTVKGATANQKAGIYLNGADGCNVSNSNISNNCHGIYLSYSNNNVISNNHALDNWYNDYTHSFGIELYHSSTNTINNNTCSGSMFGVHIVWSSNNMVLNNISSNNKNGISIWDSYENTLTNNIVEMNVWNGIYILTQAGGWTGNNIVTNNLISGNSIGIALRSPTYTAELVADTSINTNVVSNNGTGILIDNVRGTGNYVYMNNFINNTNSTETRSWAIVSWNSTERITYTYKGRTYTSYLGNYWGDYTGSDADVDGIGDIPYPIDSDSDNYPLVEPFENYLSTTDLSPWPMFGHDSQHTGRSSHVGPEIATLKWKFQAGAIIASSPAIAKDGTIYFGSRDNYFYSLKPDGTLKWKFQARAGIDSSPAIGADGTVYFGSYDGYLYALNVDGSLKWKVSGGIYIFSSPAIGADGTVYVCSNSELLAVSPNGFIKWRHQGGSNIVSSPAIGPDGTVYFGSDVSFLYAVNQNGSLKWKFQTGDDVNGSPAVGADGTVYFGSSDQHFYALNPDGSLRWKIGTGGPIAGAPAIGADDTVYFSSYDRYLYALNPDGSVKWRFPLGVLSLAGASVGADGVVYFPGDRSLLALNPNGSLNWKCPMGGGSTSWPAIGADRTIYLGAWDGYLYAFGPAPIPPTNQPPIANAGSDQTVEVNTSVTLDGSASYDPDGDSLTFSWTQAAGPLFVALSNPTSMRPTFTPTVPGSYTFRLVVNDGKVDSTPDYVTITITIPAPNQPPIPPTYLFQYNRTDAEIPVGGTIFEETVILLGVVSDPDGDRVKLQIELRRLDEYAGSFAGIPTHESEFVENSYGVTISIHSLIAGSYHWRARTVDAAGSVSEWVDFGNNDISETDFAVATEIVFRPPYRLSNTLGWSEPFLLGQASYYTEVDPSVGNGKIMASATVSYGGYGEALAAFTLGDNWRNDWSGTSNIAATFNITGLITWTRFSFPKYFTQAYLGVNLKASLWVYDHSNSTEIWRKDLIIYNEGPEWKVISLPEGDAVSYSDTQYVIQGFVDLEKDHTYSWYFEAKIWSRVDVSGFATAVAGGNFVKYGNIELIDVRIAPPVLKPEPEPIVTGENVMYVAVGSPVDVLVVDPEGKRIGFDIASQQEVNEIHEAWYSGLGTHPQLMIIPTPIAGNYKVLIFGTGTGLYNAVIFTRYTTQETVSFMASDIPTSAGAVHQYTIDWDTLSQGGEGVTVLVDSNGDGIFERTLISDSELTHDEFIARPPVAEAGVDQTVLVVNDCRAEVTLDGTGSFDPDGDTLTYVWTGSFGTASGPSPTVRLPLGTHAITLTVNDGKGGTASDNVTITVKDGTPPKITKLAASPNVLWPPDHKMVPVSVNVSVSDNCDSKPVCKITSISSNEPENGLGDGDTAPDWKITGNLTLNLRAERSGKGKGRVYTINVMCKDVYGNGSAGTATVTVPHDKGK
jgi:parallel beta-helix repeat protein